MKFTQTITVAILAAVSVSAAPAKSTIHSRGTPAPVPNWIIEQMQRTCAEDDSLCTWHFFINPQIADVTECTYVVEAPNASQAQGGPVNCGDYTITSGWDAGGWTTFSIVDNPQRYIAFPAWNDGELHGGNVLGPKNAVVELLPQPMP